MITGSLSDGDSPLHSFKASVTWDVEVLKQIARILLDTDVADVLVLGLKIFMPVSYSSL